MALVGTSKVNAEVDIRLVLGMGREEDNLAVGSHTASENAVVAGSRNSEDSPVPDCTFRSLVHVYCDVSVCCRGSVSAWRVAQSRCEAAVPDECPRDRPGFLEESGNDGGDPPNGCSLPVASRDVDPSPGNLRLFVCSGLLTFASLLLCVHLRIASREIVILGGGGTPFPILEPRFYLRARVSATSLCRPRFRILDLGTIRRIWKCFGCCGGTFLGLSRVVVGSLGGDDKTLTNVGGSGVNDGDDDGGGGGGQRPRLGCEAEPTSVNYGALCDPDSANATALSLRSYFGVGAGVGEVMGTGRVLQQTGSAEEVQRCLAWSLLAHDAGAAIHLPDRVLDLKGFLDAHGGNPPPAAGANLLPRAVVIPPFGLIKMCVYGNGPEERQRSGKPVEGSTSTRRCCSEALRRQPVQ